jgi:hypothetical protein
MRALVIALALASCTMTPPPNLPPPELPQRAGIDPLVAARAAGVVYQGRGEGFTLALHRDRHIAFTWGEAEHAFFNPTLVQPAYRGEIYEAIDGARTLRVEIRNGPCLDAESGETWSATVSVQLDGEIRRGCGRGL